MSNETITERGFNEEVDSWSSLEIVLREGARKLLQQALEIEVEEYLHKQMRMDTVLLSVTVIIRSVKSLPA